MKTVIPIQQKIEGSKKGSGASKSKASGYPRQLLLVHKFGLRLLVDNFSYPLNSLVRKSIQGVPGNGGKAVQTK